MSTGQLFTYNEEGGYAYSDELSETLRTAVQPLTKMRQFANVKDGSKKGLKHGEKFHWNIYSNVGTQGRRLDERKPVPETGVTIRQGELIVYEAGNSVPYSGKLDLLAKQDILEVIDNGLKDDARKFFDIASWEEFNKTPLRIAPFGGNSASAISLDTDGRCRTTNNAPLGTGHVKATVDMMKERNIPPFMDEDYVCVANTTTFRPFRNQLEDIVKYNPEGLGHIFRGEIGKYEGCRFVEQTFLPKGGAYDSTIYDPYSNTPDPWDNNQSSWAFFMGGDTVTEAMCVPEELRSKLPGDYGRSKGLMWYALLGYGLVHTDPTQARVLKWDSAN